jgi:SAM-dependent methyltransferase
MTFMNLGYLSDPSDLDDVDTAEIVDQVSERLYDRVVGDVDLTGRTAVEVGCGPGAGSAHVAGAYGPASLLGVDLSHEMIAWCREHHTAANLRFKQGNAQDLPIASNSVDAVINVESSHCYPSRLLFFEEVKRVLRPGGSFLFADIIWTGRKKRANDIVSPQLDEAGLIIEDCADITENVMAARSAISRSRAFQSHMRERTPALMVPFVEECIFLPGSKFYARMASREVRYLLWRVSKPSEDIGTSSVIETAGMVVE